MTPVNSSGSSTFPGCTRPRLQHDPLSRHALRRIASPPYFLYGPKRGVSTTDRLRDRATPPAAVAGHRRGVPPPAVGGTRSTRPGASSDHAGWSSYRCRVGKLGPQLQTKASARPPRGAAEGHIGAPGILRAHPEQRRSAGGTRTGIRIPSSILESRICHRGVPRDHRTSTAHRVPAPHIHCSRLEHRVTPSAEQAGLRKHRREGERRSAWRFAPAENGSLSASHLPAENLTDDVS